MNLQEFVKNVLIDLDAAVSSASNEASRKIYFSRTGDKQTVEFDIAVTTENGNSSEKSARIRVLEFVSVGGNSETERWNSTVSHVRFGVSIDGSTKEELSQLKTRY